MTSAQITEGDRIRSRGVPLQVNCVFLAMARSGDTAPCNEMLLCAGGIELPSDHNFPVRLVQFLELAYFVAAQSSQVRAYLHQSFMMPCDQPFVHRSVVGS